MGPFGIEREIRVVISEKCGGRRGGGGFSAHTPPLCCFLESDGEPNPFDRYRLIR